MSADLEEWSGGGRAWFSSSLQMWFIDFEYAWAQVAIAALLYALDCVAFRAPQPGDAAANVLAACEIPPHPRGCTLP